MVSCAQACTASGAAFHPALAWAVAVATLLAAGGAGATEIFLSRMTTSCTVKGQSSLSAGEQVHRQTAATVQA